MIGHCSKHIRVPKPNHAQVTACRAYPLSKSIPKPLQIQLINKAELYEVKFPSGTHTDKRKSEVCTWASRHGCQKISQTLKSARRAETFRTCIKAKMSRSNRIKKETESNPCLLPRSGGTRTDCSEAFTTCPGGGHLLYRKIFFEN